MRVGESQRVDGRYCYKYTDGKGKSQFVYSWKLTKTDRLPVGKKECRSLRELEEDIQKALESEIDVNIGDQILINALTDFVEGKVKIKETTRTNYLNIISAIKDDKFVQLPIREITTAKAKKWVKERTKVWGFGRLSGAKALFSSMFSEFIEDGELTKNPFSFKLSKIVANDAKERKALTPQLQEQLLDFVWNSNVYRKYYYSIKFLIATGIRVAELSGLTESDIDFEEKTIKIDHQLQVVKGEKRIVTPKTKSSIRNLPITDEIRECLEEMIKSRPKSDYSLDGYTDFIVCTRKGEPCTDQNWYSRFESLTKAFNEFKGTDLSVISPHILRHSFVTNQINRGVPVKIVSYLAGHADVSITLNVYTDINYEDVRKAILNE